MRDIARSIAGFREWKRHQIELVYSSQERVSKKRILDSWRERTADQVDDALCWLRIMTVGSRIDKRYISAHRSPGDINTLRHLRLFVAPPEEDRSDSIADPKPFFGDADPGVLRPPFQYGSLVSTGDRTAPYYIQSCVETSCSSSRREFLVVGYNVGDNAKAFPSAMACFHWDSSVLTKRSLTHSAKHPARQFVSPREERMFRALCSLGLEERYQWQARISWNDNSILLPTDPTGARALFALRDKPAGAARRPAIRHWVREHWRACRNDPDSAAFVTAHLRGETNFEWEGWNVTIVPSQFDRELDKVNTITTAIMKGKGLPESRRASVREAVFDRMTPMRYAIPDLGDLVREMIAIV